MIIRRGTHNGLNWFLVVNDIGGKCVYVAVPAHRFSDAFSAGGEAVDVLDGDPAKLEKVNEKINLCLDGIHGGCTYLTSCLPNLRIRLPSKCVVVGWDYCHLIDMKANSEGEPLFPLVFTCTDDQIYDDIKAMIDSFIRIEHNTKR